MEAIDKFQAVVVERPTDVIVRQIRELINKGELKKGDRLPAERVLSERFGVGRTYVRDAIKKMEFYGILKTLPQSGTIVEGPDIKVLDGMLSNILELDKHDFLSLVEARVVLEEQSIRLCALRRTDDDLKAIKAALIEYENSGKEDNVNADFELHRAIAVGSKNRVLQSMCLLLTSDILFHYHQFGICGYCNETTLTEHTALYEAIKEQDADKAASLMRVHLNHIHRFAQNRMAELHKGKTNC